MISNECLNSYAHKRLRPQIMPFFCENIASLKFELEILESRSISPKFCLLILLRLIVLAKTLL